MTRAGLLICAILVLGGCGRLIPAPPTTRLASSAGPVRTGADGGAIDAPIDDSTYARLSRAGSSLGQCLATLDAARVRFSPVPDRVNSATCSLTDAGQLGPDMGTVARMQPADPTLTCATALALSVWRRQSVEPAAREILGSDVVQIDHYGTYACRPVNNQAGNRPSAHSRAAAIDFAGVRLRDGRRITIAADWNDGGPESRFLHRIRDDACKVFGTTLSPDYNAFHRDHLHLEMDQGRLCR